MDVEGLVAIIMVFGTGMLGVIAFSPIGRAISTRILHRGSAGAMPEVSEQLDELAERVEAVQRQVAELAERQDFTERLLAKAREKGLPAGGGAS